MAAAPNDVDPIAARKRVYLKEIEFRGGIMD
jgi:hypothetical protein